MILTTNRNFMPPNSQCCSGTVLCPACSERVINRDQFAEPQHFEPADYRPMPWLTLDDLDDHGNFKGGITRNAPPQNQQPAITNDRRAMRQYSLTDFDDNGRLVSR